MKHTIENEYLRVEAQNLSGELTSLFSKKLQREFLWQPGAEIFPNQAKNLFPNVGMVNLERNFIQGREYPAIQHGFLKDTELSLEEKTETKLVFQLESNEETAKYLPYRFTLQIIFSLQGPKLHQTYRIENHSDGAMYFGIGAHTAFYCPIALGEQASDYVLCMEDQKELEEILRTPETSLRNGMTRRRELIDGRLPLEDGFFDDGAKIFTGFTAHKIKLLSQKSSLFVCVEFEDFPYCTLWSRKGPLYYICIEPWCGLPDCEESDHIFESKEGNVCLPAGEVFSRTQKFEVGIDSSGLR